MRGTVRRRKLNGKPHISKKTGQSIWQLGIETGKKDEPRQRKWKSFIGTKKDAEAALRSFIKSENERAVDKDNVTISEFLDDWLKAIKTKKSVGQKTHDRYTQMVNQNIKPKLGGISLQKLTSTNIQYAWDSLLVNGNAYGAGLAPKTIRNIHSCLSSALRFAKARHLVNSIETVGIELPKVEEKEITILTHEDSIDLIEGLEGHWLQPIVIIALYTGMRLGEILGLKWRNVSLEEGSINVRWAISETKDDGLLLKEPKTKSGRRTIALTSQAINTLRKVLVDQNERSLRFGAGKSNDAYVFDDWHRANGEHGKPTPPHYVTTSFIRYMKGIDVPRIRFHDLRHTHISQLLLDGHPVLAVAKRAGHKSTQMTLDVYGHLLKGFDKEMMKDFDKKLEQVKYKRTK